MMNQLTFTLATLVAFICAVFPVSAAKAETCPLTAERLLRESETETDLSLRERLIRRAIQSCPDEAKPYLYLGRHFERSGKPGAKQGFQAYQEALRRTPVAAEVFNRAAGSNFNNAQETIWGLVSPLLHEHRSGNGQFPKNGSTESLRAREPKGSDERMGLAKELTRIGESELRDNQAEGEALLLRAVELAPEYKRPQMILFRNFLRLGEYSFRKEHYRAANSYYRKALKYVPDDPRVLKRVTDTYDAMGGHEKEKLAYLERTVSALENGRPARARVAKDEAVAQGKRAWEVGKSFLAASDYGNALRAFKVAVAWMPENALVHFDLAAALTRVDSVSNAQAALNHFERSRVLFRENPPPEAGHLEGHFQRRLRIEIDYLTGKTNPWGYLLSRTSQTVREKALEMSLFLLFLVGVSGYLLRAGYRLKENTKY